MTRTGESSRRPTISDVAALAGVSKGAVSRAFNGGKGISPSTIDRIHHAASMLDWQPNSTARAMSGGMAGSIGLVFRRPTELLDLDPFFHSFLSGVESALIKADQSATLKFVDSPESEVQAYRRLFNERRVDGFILTDLRASDARFDLLRRLGAPTVVAGTPTQDCPFPRVGTGTRAAFADLVSHLIAQGHTTIGHVTGLDSLQHSDARLRIWRDTLLEAGLIPGPLEHGDFSSEGGARATERMLARSGPRPTAIIYANDMMALAGMSTLTQHGLRIPEDVAITGFDNIPLASYSTPRLTTIGCDYVAMGRVATQTLLDSINGVVEPDFATEIGGTIYLRESTEPGPA